MSRPIAALAILLASCTPGGSGGSQTNPTPDAAPTVDADATPEPGVLSAGGTTLAWDETASSLTLSRDGVALLSLGPADWTLGTVDTLDSSLSYDPYFYEFATLHPAYEAAEDLVWRSATAVTLTASSETTASLHLGFDEGFECTVEITLSAVGRYELRWLPTAQADRVALFRVAATVDPSEGFYGLGEHFDDVNHRGHVRPMQFEYSEVESGYNEVHVPVPLLIGTTGWGFFAPTPYPSVFGVANQADDRMRFTVATGPASSAGLTMYLFAEAHPLDITQHYYEVTGYPALPATWALGPWIWRDEVQGQVAVEADLQAIRDLDLPTSGYWIDRPFASAVNSFDWNPSTYTDAPAMIALAQSLGFRMAIWQAPYLHASDPSTADLLAEAKEKGYLPEVATTGGLKWGPMLDFTNPEAYAWWQDHVRFYTDMGVEGFKLDYGEDVAAVMVGFGVRLPWLFDDGSTELEMQSQFVRWYHDVYAETLPAEGGFLLCRSGTYGDQVNGVIVWPGDLDATMALHGDEVDDGEGGTYKSVGGMPAALIGGLGLGPSGFPFYGSDTGGYRHAPPDKETYMRWFEATALSPVMQVGTNANDLPWSFGEDKISDPEILDAYRAYARLHMRLFPYVWTYARRLADDGRAIQRPLGLAYPELGVHPWDTFLLGDHLLVAPVVEAGATSRDVILPPGQWVDWWTGAVYEGNQTVTRDAPLDVLPLFARAGAPIPLLRPTVDTTATASDPTVDSFGSDPGVLYVAVAPGAQASFTLYDETLVTQATQGAPGEARTVEISVLPGETFAQGVVVELYGVGVAEVLPTVTSGSTETPRAETAAAIGAGTVGWAWSEARGGTVWIHAPGGAQSFAVALPAVERFIEP